MISLLSRPYFSSINTSYLCRCKCPSLQHIEVGMYPQEEAVRCVQRL